MRIISDIRIFEKIPVLVRTALDVPIVNGKVVDSYRLRRALATIEYLAKRHARVILVGHSGEKGTETLRPAAEALKQLIHNVSFCEESIGPIARRAVRDLAPGGILVLENLRRHRGEVLNEIHFARELATLADIFVEDDFPTCHRVHASIVTLPKLLPAYAGLLVQEEVAALESALTPTHPALAVIGGAKVSTKEPVLTKLLTTYDHVFVGGALANDFLKASGHEVGKSLVGSYAKHALAHMLLHKKLLLPLDLIVAPHDAPSLKAARVAHIDDVRSDESILDVGPATSACITTLAQKAENVLWNGPLGNYENGFRGATDAFAQAVATSNAHSVVGGGDTIASIQKLDLLSEFSFVSTGGGAMLDYLARGTLPGIEALG